MAANGNVLGPQRIISLLEDICEEALVGDFGLGSADARQRLNEELAYYRNLHLAGHSLPADYY